MSDVSAQQVALAAIKSTPLLNALNRWIPVVCEVQRRILSAGRARSRTDVIGPAGLRRAIGLAGLRRPAGGEKFAAFSAIFAFFNPFRSPEIRRRRRRAKGVLGVALQPQALGRYS